MNASEPPPPNEPMHDGDCPLPDDAGAEADRRGSLGSLLGRGDAVVQVSGSSREDGDGDGDGGASESEAHEHEMWTTTTLDELMGDASSSVASADDDALQGCLEHLPPAELERRVGVHIVPAGHFEALGHDDHYAQCLVQHFQIDLLREILYLQQVDRRHTGEKVRIDIGREGQASYLLHDDALLPLWRAFRDALLACPSTRAYGLTVQNVHLSSEVVGMLSAALRGKQITSLAFRNVLLRKAGFAFAAEVMRETIRVLTSVTFDGCRAGSDLEALHDLANAARNNVNNLGLARNGIGPEGGRILADVLRDDPPVEGIWLCDNQLGDEGIAHLMDALGTNAHLQTMHIERNGVTPAGLSALEKATFDTATMETVRRSNHTCRLHYAGLRQFKPEHLTCWGTLSPSRYSENVMKQKMYTAFGNCAESSPVECKYLEDVPAELIPEALAFARRVPYYCEVVHAWMDASGESEGGRRTSLGNVYDVVRGWVVPLAFGDAEEEGDDKGVKRKRAAEGTSVEEGR